MMGTAPGFVPQTLDRSLLDEIVLVGEAEAFAMCRRIARQEGLLVGISSGATVHAALEIAKAESELVIVCILADTGQRYLSVAGLFEQ
jgi:cysteine synthase A